MKNTKNQMLKAYKNNDFRLALELANELESSLDPHFNGSPCDEFFKVLQIKMSSAQKIAEFSKAAETAKKALFYAPNDATSMIVLADISKNFSEKFFYLKMAKPFVELWLEQNAKSKEKNNKIMHWIFRYLNALGCARLEYEYGEAALKTLIKAQDFAKENNLTYNDRTFRKNLAVAYSHNFNYQKCIDILWELYKEDNSDESVLSMLCASALRLSVANENDENLLLAWILHEKRFYDYKNDNKFAMAVINKFAGSQQLMLNDFEASGRDIHLLDNKKILLFSRQGMGDNIMYMRCIDELLKVAKRVHIIVQRPLTRLFKETFKTADVFSGDESVYKVPDIDYALPICSLPLFFCSQKIIISPPLLKSIFTPKKMGKIKKIGIFWKTEAHRNAKWGNDGTDRTMELYPLILALNKYKLYSFQVDINEKDKELFKKYDITDLGSGFNDFYDTLLAFKNIDLLVCIDTAIVHLALLAGVKTAVLLPFDFDWRWGRFEAPKSPWWSEATLCACDRVGQWQSAINKLKEYLKSF